ncbi:unnamed protein product, partial [Mesorhabditis spiculigera]
MPMRGPFHVDAHRPGPELDPCLAAERRLKTTTFSKRMKCGICVMALLIMGIIIFAVAIYTLIAEAASPSAPALGRTTTTTKRPLTTPAQIKAAKILPPKQKPKPKVVHPKSITRSNITYPSCAHVKAAKLPSGVYTLKPAGREFEALCDSSVAGGGWTTIQKRISSETSFYNRTWEEYKNGFGDLHENHWLGLQSMYELQNASSTPHTLRIELHGDYCVDASKCSGMPDGEWWGEWQFSLGNEASGYRLNLITRLKGTLNNKTDHFLTSHNGVPFTTFDRDNDREPEANCAQIRMFGGWWHIDCGYTALNGAYGDSAPKRRYQYWYHEHDSIGYYIHPKKSFIFMR